MLDLDSILLAVFAYKKAVEKMFHSSFYKKYLTSILQFRIVFIV